METSNGEAYSVKAEQMKAVLADYLARATPEQLRTEIDKRQSLQKVEDPGLLTAEQAAACIVKHYGKSLAVLAD